MKVLSLFDGISCANYVLEKLGFDIEAYYSSEIDKHAITISEANFPNQIRLGDITKCREWNIDFSQIDLPDGNYEFRKLTPIECERLQGLPDDYTASVPKSHRYKALGNAWQCDTISYILKHLRKF